MTEAFVFKYQSDHFSSFQGGNWGQREQGKKRRDSREAVLGQRKGIWRLGVCFAWVLVSDLDWSSPLKATVYSPCDGDAGKAMSSPQPTRFTVAENLLGAAILAACVVYVLCLLPIYLERFNHLPGVTPGVRVQSGLEPGWSYSRTFAPPPSPLMLLPASMFYEFCGQRALLGPLF